jgi:hypothetical protein
MFAKSKLLLFLFSISFLLIGCGGGGGSEQGQPPQPPKIIVDGYSVLIDSFADFGPRDSAKMIKLENKLLLISGWYRYFSSYQDAWISEDGAQSWDLQSGNIHPLNNKLIDPIYYEDPLLPKPYSPIVSFGNSILAISGDGLVWKSLDIGKTWQILSYSGPMTPLFDSLSLVVLKNKLILNSIDSGIVWLSDDGITWSRNSMSGIELLGSSTLVQSQEKLWIFGGSPLATGDYGPHNLYVWVSDDGISWAKVQAGGTEIKVPWVGRNWACSVVDPMGNIWMLAGYNSQSQKNLNDVWYTKDFITWNKVLQPISKSYDPMHAPVCAYLDSNKAILLASGKGGMSPDNNLAATTNSIWYFYPTYK